MQWRHHALTLLPLLLILGLCTCLPNGAAAQARIRIVEPGNFNAPPAFALDAQSPNAQSPNAQSLDAPQQGAVERVVQEGTQLERENRWGEALAHYEQALRKFPGDPLLRRRHDLAKLHYDLGRRYGDDSFQKSLATLRTHEALDQYSEVLAKIETHYVDRPDWRHLVERGALALEIALDRDEFKRQHLAQVAVEQIEAFRRAVRATVAASTVRNRNDARSLVASISTRGERQLGLSSVATTYEFVCGAIGGLDNYSAYLTSGQLKDVYSQIDGNFVGLGIELKADNGALLIMNVIPGSPAEQAGIRGGDRIVAVDGQSTHEMTTDSAANVLQGPEGSVAVVTVETPGRPNRTLQIRRQHVEVPSVDRIEMLDPERGVAYFRLAGFQRTTNRDVDRALWQLHREGMKSLIIDLRGNPGGLLSAAVEVADKFIDRGSIVSTKGRNPGEDYQYTAHQVATWRVPLVVLIDGDSASASEIFAGAIRDHRRGTIVGERSYGKGSVQGIFPLGIGGAGVRLTTAKFYSPSGAAISDVGVSPDVVVHATAKPIAATGQRLEENDPMLQAALQTARQDFAQR